MSLLEAFVLGADSVFTLAANLQQRGDERSSVEQAKRDYREGHIDAAEFERRLQFHLDDETARSGRRSSPSRTSATIPRT